MPEPDYIIASNDRGLDLARTLTDEDEVPVNLTGASVQFQMALMSSGSVVVASPGTIVAATAGEVSYQWQAADTDAPGWYLGQWQVTYGGGDVQTFPNGDPIRILVTNDLA